MCSTTEVLHLSTIKHANPNFASCYIIYLIKRVSIFNTFPTTFVITHQISRSNLKTVELSLFKPVFCSGDDGFCRQNQCGCSPARIVFSLFFPLYLSLFCYPLFLFSLHVKACRSMYLHIGQYTGNVSLIYNNGCVGTLI